tara:strand:+ start:24824 stop:25105 length:282 start_codon:yes stop_codon:yes gene_type:complete
MIAVISQIELEGTDSLKYTDIGYTEDENLIIQINEEYDETLGKFIAENRTKLNIGEVSLSIFFATTEYVNEARTIVDTVEGRDLPLITSLNQL